ncbi:MAG: hypothetical protein HC942_13480 [Microcoleus sp. SU_5_6]|nr:hypothetical protein [Microcoleus sp. SU_5_6]
MSIIFCQVTKYQLLKESGERGRITNYQLSTVNCQLSTLNSQLSTIREYGDPVRLSRIAASRQHQNFKP